MRCGSDEHLLACRLSKWKGDKTRCRWCDKPLAGRQQRWCSQKCPDEYGRNHWWSDARKAALKRDKYTCRGCGAKGKKAASLQIHHVRMLRSRKFIQVGKKKRPVTHSDGGCWHHLRGLITLCKVCHLKEHAAIRERIIRP